MFFTQIYHLQNNLPKIPLWSWHFLFLRSINNGKDDDNSNNTAAAGANKWGLYIVLYLALHILSYLTLKQTHDVYNYFNYFTDDKTKAVLQGLLVKGLYL